MPDHLTQIRRLFGSRPIAQYLSMHAITQIVVDKSRVGMRDIMFASRRLSVTDPRHVAWYLCKQHLQKTYHQMARHFERDHSTIINGVQRIERIRREQSKIELLITQCQAEITGEWP